MGWKTRVGVGVGVGVGGTGFESGGCFVFVQFSTFSFNFGADTELGPSQRATFIH